MGLKILSRFLGMLLVPETSVIILEHPDMKVSARMPGLLFAVGSEGGR